MKITNLLKVFYALLLKLFFRIRVFFSSNVWDKDIFSNITVPIVLHNWNDKTTDFYIHIVMNDTQALQLTEYQPYWSSSITKLLTWKTILESNLFDNVSNVLDLLMSYVLFYFHKNKSMKLITRPHYILK